MSPELIDAAALIRAPEGVQHCRCVVRGYSNASGIIPYHAFEIRPWLGQGENPFSRAHTLVNFRRNAVAHRVHDAQVC